MSDKYKIFIEYYAGMGTSEIMEKYAHSLGELWDILTILYISTLHGKTSFNSIKIYKLDENGNYAGIS